MKTQFTQPADMTAMVTRHLQTTQMGQALLVQTENGLSITVLSDKELNVIDACTAESLIAADSGKEVQMRSARDLSGMEMKEIRQIGTLV